MIFKAPSLFEGALFLIGQVLKLGAYCNLKREDSFSQKCSGRATWAFEKRTKANLSISQKRVGCVQMDIQKALHVLQIRDGVFANITFVCVLHDYVSACQKVNRIRFSKIFRGWKFYLNF